MKTALIICVILGILWMVGFAVVSLISANKANQPHKVKIVGTPAPDPRIADLEARVTGLENWAAKQGRRY